MPPGLKFLVALHVCATGGKESSSWRDFIGPEVGDRFTVSEARMHVSVGHLVMEFLALSWKRTLSDIPWSLLPLTRVKS